MPLKTTRGLVISEKPFNESDKIITIFSEEGKFKAIANGVKHPKSTLAAGCRLFAWSEFQYYPGKNFARISQANLIDSFYSISSNLNVISYASYIADLINNFYDDFQIDKIILKHLVYYFFYLKKDINKVYLLTLAFQIKLLIANGLIPNIKEIPKLDLDRPVYFIIENSEFSNTKIKNKIGYRLTKDQLKILIDFYRLPLNKINQLNLSNYNQEDLKKLIIIFNTYIQHVLSKSLKSFEILKEIEESSFIEGD